MLLIWVACDCQALGVRVGGAKWLFFSAALGRKATMPRELLHTATATFRRNMFSTFIAAFERGIGCNRFGGCTGQA